jgi:hypothetical protein
MRKAILIIPGIVGLVLYAAPLLAEVSLTEVAIPQYVEAANSSTRIPAVFRVTLSGLTPDATYSYFMQAVISSDGAAVSGAGNSFFLDATYNFYTSSPSMNTVGTTCSQFTADGSGSYTGWMGLVTTGNSRFTAGNTIYLRVMLNDGAGGTGVATRVTAASGCTAIGFGTTSSDATGIYQTASGFTAKNVVLLYDNPMGTGRPLATGIVQDEGVTLPSSVTFYGSLVDAVATAWGTIIPNNLPTGVQRIEERANDTGSVVQSLTDADGVWYPNNTSTVSPSGGATAIDLTGATSEPPVSTLPTTIGRLKARYR